MPQLTGTLVASTDGLLIAHDLPAHIGPAGMARHRLEGIEEDLEV
ncbi:hypothetical protein [Nocardia sp. NPDC059228]